MKVVWIGQAGLVIYARDLVIMADPYLSESASKLNPKHKRRIPVNEELFGLKPDVMIFTHDHLDHYDPETAPRFINEKTCPTVLSPSSVYPKARALDGNGNFVVFDRHTEWTEGGVRFTAVKAEHSDPRAIGVIIDDGEEKLYITGDTLYNNDIFADVPKDIDMMFLPINGVGNNMNAADAVRFARRVCPKIAVPVHFGMFDAIDPRVFDFERAVIPRLYEEVKL